MDLEPIAAAVVVVVVVTLECQFNQLQERNRENEWQFPKVQSYSSESNESSFKSSRRGAHIARL